MARTFDRKPKLYETGIILKIIKVEMNMSSDLVEWSHARKAPKNTEADDTD